MHIVKEVQRGYKLRIIINVLLILCVACGFIWAGYKLSNKTLGMDYIAATNKPSSITHCWPEAPEAPELYGPCEYNEDTDRFEQTTHPGKVAAYLNDRILLGDLTNANEFRNIISDLCYLIGAIVVVLAIVYFNHATLMVKVSQSANHTYQKNSGEPLLKNSRKRGHKSTKDLGDPRIISIL